MSGALEWAQDTVEHTLLYADFRGQEDLLQMDMGYKRADELYDSCLRGCKCFYYLSRLSVELEMFCEYGVEKNRWR